jgi:hypothetical protein
MDSLPPALLDFISIFHPLLGAEVFESFTYLLCGLLIGEAKRGTVPQASLPPPSINRNAYRIYSAGTSSRDKR